jgi:uncharacterized protein (DUF608 family)
MAVGGLPVLGGAKLPESTKKASLSKLLERGQPEIYSGDELKFIGMPVGGFFAGTVYLGGDGQLWNWDIFNEGRFGSVLRTNATFMGDNLNASSGANYVDPVHQQSPFSQQFRLLIADPSYRTVRFGDIRFRGEYPIGKVSYREADADVEMSLEAFSPFCPLDAEKSCFPATTLTFLVKNVGAQERQFRLEYETENPVLINSKRLRDDYEFTGASGGFGVFLAARGRPQPVPNRPDVLFEDWSSGTYGKWVAMGSAFGKTPRKVSELPAYMGDVEAGTEYVANSHEARNGEDVAGGDGHTGTLTSPPFLIERKYLLMRVGGGAHVGTTCVNLLVDGTVVASVTGHNRNAMAWETIPTQSFEGKSAQIQVVDRETGAWGNISLGEVIFSDAPKNQEPLEQLPDFGSFCAGFVGGTTNIYGDPPSGRVNREFKLQPGESKELTLVIAWHFPNCSKALPGKKNWYATKWPDAKAVLVDIVSAWPKLQQTARLWNNTWYDSTLPYWFLDRTFLNISTLATTTCHRLDDGRYYFWEGVGCCAGTCTHVWGYGQAIGRLFPEIERYLRKEIDFGLAYHADTGAIDYRCEFGRAVAHDGQASCILRAYREHQTSPDNQFLASIWPQVKGAMQRLMRQDPGHAGILEGAQYNTLDTSWYGEIAWISSLYIAALRACEAMATVMNDVEFSKACRETAEKGSSRLVSELFNGEYFINRVDKDHPEANNTNVGCHIDQIYGQSWAHQVGLPRIVPREQAVSALKALFKHSFYDDVWEYRRKNRAIPGGRWYATPQEAGLIMCSFPRGGAAESFGKGEDAWAVGYFNECMSGFEYQVAAHMIAERLVREGLAVVRAIHERYHPSKRNPYNEVECSDHYGRATASFAAFISICGFQVNRPAHERKFAPKTAGAFRAAFIDGGGWGTYSRKASGEEVVQPVFSL